MTATPWSFQLSQLSAPRLQQVVSSHSGVPALALVSIVVSVDESLPREASPLCVCLFLQSWGHLFAQGPPVSSGAKESFHLSRWKGDFQGPYM